jgi:hypothetical protein
MRPTKESGIAKAATGTGTRFSFMSGSSVRVLLARVPFKVTRVAAKRYNLKYEERKGKLVVRLSEKLGDIDLSPEASSISRYIPTLLVTFGKALESVRLND